MNRLLVLNGDAVVSKKYDFVWMVESTNLYVLYADIGYILERVITYVNRDIVEYALSNKVRKHFKHDWVILDPECFMHYIYNKMITQRKLSVMQSLDYITGKILQ